MPLEAYLYVHLDGSTLQVAQLRWLKVFYDCSIILCRSRQVRPTDRLFIFVFEEQASSPSSSLSSSSSVIFILMAERLQVFQLRWLKAFINLCLC